MEMWTLLATSVVSKPPYSKTFCSHCPRSRYTLLNFLHLNEITALLSNTTESGYQSCESAALYMSWWHHPQQHTQQIPPYWPSRAHLLATSLESAHLAEPLLPRVKACALETDTMDSGKGVPQVVCLALHNSRRCHILPLYITTLMHSHEPRCGETEEHGKKAGGNMRGRQRGKTRSSLGHPTPVD